MPGTPALAEKQIHEEVKEVDGEFFTISVFQAQDARKLRFKVHQPGVPDEYELSLSDQMLQQLLVHDQALLQPSQSQDLVSWLMTRLVIARNAGKIQLSVAGMESDSARDKASVPMKVPPQRLSFAERMKIKKQFEILEATRAAKLQEREKAQREKFLAEVSEKQKKAEQTESERATRIQREKDERAQQKRLQREQQHQQQIIKQQLEAKRYAIVTGA